MQKSTNKFDISGFLKLAFNERAELWVLFPCEQSGSRRKSELQIGTPGLAHRALRGFVIQDIVHKLMGRMSMVNAQVGWLRIYLEGNSNVTTVSVCDLLPNLAFLATTKNDGGPRTLGYETSRLQVSLP